MFKALNKALRPKMKPGMGPISHEKGTTFRVWAPNAQKVFVTGDFNDWNDTASPPVSYTPLTLPTHPSV